MTNTRYVEQTHVGRGQSPAVEHAMQDRLATAFSKLLETKGLYQNIALPADFLSPFGAPPYTAEALVSEFKKRPIHPCSHGEGDELDGLGQTLRSMRGNEPLGTPHDELSLLFFLPNIHAVCLKCKHETMFLSLAVSGQSHLGPYPLIGEETEQVYHLYFRCAACRSACLVFQVLRRGLRFQLTGRSVPMRPNVAADWPKDVREVVADAVSAAAENDVPAAYYHLRTALEFLMKEAVAVPIKDKIEGSELCERYAAQLDQRMKQGMPSLAPIHSALSAGLHTRDVSRVEFERMLDESVKHLKAKALFSEFGAHQQ